MIYIVLAYFIVLLIVAIKKQYWGVSVFMISLYLFSLCFSVVLVLENYQNITPGFFSSFVFCTAITLLFSPYFIKNPIIEAPSATEVHNFRLIFTIISVVFIICDIIVFPAVSLAFSASAMDIRTGNAMSFTSVLTGYASLAYYLVSLLYGLSYLLIILFFYSLVFIKKGFVFKVLLLVASLTSPYLGVLDGGRTNLTYWFLFAIVSLVIFKPYFKKGLSTKALLLLLIPMVGMISYFVITTKDRFEMSEVGTTGGLIEYAGQSFVYFCDFFDNFNSPTYSLQRIFPNLSSLIYGSFDLEEYRFMVQSKSGMNIGVFYTLLGDLLVDVGLVGMFIYVFVYRGITRHFVRRRSFYLSDIIMLSLLLQIPIHGIFYYSLWTTKASDAMIVTIFLYLFFRRTKENRL